MGERSVFSYPRLNPNRGLAEWAGEWSPQGLILLSWLGERAFLAPVTDGGRSKYADEEQQSPRLSLTLRIGQSENVPYVKTGFLATDQSFLERKRKMVQMK